MFGRHAQTQPCMHWERCPVVPKFGAAGIVASEGPGAVRCVIAAGWPSMMEPVVSWSNQEFWRSQVWRSTKSTIHNVFFHMYEKRMFHAVKNAFLDLVHGTFTWFHMPCVYACLRFEQAPGLVVGSCRLRHPGPLLVRLLLVVLDIDVHEFSSRNGMLYDLVVFPGPFPRVLDHVLRKAGSCFSSCVHTRASWAPEHDHITLS